MNRPDEPSPLMRVLAVLLLVLAILGALYAWFTLGTLGFPDGHLTEFERAWEKLLQFLLYGGLAFAAYFGYHIFSSRGVEAKILFWVCAGVYLLSLSAYFYKLRDYGLRLDNGQGG